MQTMGIIPGGINGQYETATFWGRPGYFRVPCSWYVRATSFGTIEASPNNDFSSPVYTCKTNIAGDGGLVFQDLMQTLIRETPGWFFPSSGSTPVSDGITPNLSSSGSTPVSDGITPNLSSSDSDHLGQYMDGNISLPAGETDGVVSVAVSFVPTMVQMQVVVPSGGDVIIAFPIIGSLSQSGFSYSLSAPPATGEYVLSYLIV